MLRERPAATDDTDLTETAEWTDAIASVVATSGLERARYLLARVAECIDGAPASESHESRYLNTIAVAEQPAYPGDLAIEARVTALIRWNALAMVVRANRAHGELGGHIATYASIAELFEVGFNHCFRAGQDGDLVFFQPHAAPGIYARAFLEGRLDEAHLEHFRRETGGRGLSSYCHPWLMPAFWQFPTGSMGLGPLTAVYQARFLRYLEDRGLAKTAGRHVWAFVGDGEMDEPESLAGLSIAGREGLDNLTFVINCNLQRLDGPVRGNGSIVRELERVFSGNGWRVIKVLWGSDWDPIFARDSAGLIAKRFDETVDGQMQAYGATDAAFNRAHFFSQTPELAALVAHLSDTELDDLTRGGHDPVKIYAAYASAMASDGRPTVILAQTKKGFGMGQWGQGKMTAHQQKKLDDDALMTFRDRFDLPLRDIDVRALRFLRPSDDSPEMRYLAARRTALGGPLPARSGDAPALSATDAGAYTAAFAGSGERSISTTMAFVAVLSKLLKDQSIGPRVVPIVADEARTFGMEALFRSVGIYSPLGQLYDPEDRDQLLYYKEARDGQILEEGISEAGALASWIAAATAYSTSGVPMLPFYIYYSMFGFQRVGDLIWAAADSRARGFLIGATAGRTTLSGEGLQHQDGTSHLIASTIPTCRAYDPCFAYEVGAIVRDGIARMLDAREETFTYMTVQNENGVHPPMPAGAERGIVRGMHRVLDGGDDASVQLLASGPIVREAIAAAAVLERVHARRANVWSVTSWSQLRWDGLRYDRERRAAASHDDAQAIERPWVAELLAGTRGPIVAASDYVGAVADLVRPWVPRERAFTSLGTDGFGMSDTRAALRAHFGVDAESIVRAALEP
jgi:pyruvate dehydrogenase E1 component